MGSKKLNVISNFSKYKYLFTQLIIKDIKLKYRRSYLGIVWTLIEPLLTMIVLTMVFSAFLGKDGEAGGLPFPVYILIGRLLYSFFSNATKGAMKSIRSNAAMIKKVYVPKYMYPMSSILSNFIIFAISLIVLIGVAVVLRVKPTVWMLACIVPIILLLFLCVGVGMILSTMAVFFRDLEYLWGVALMLIMYTCAIFYEADRLIKHGYGWLLNINPLYGVIRNFRGCISGEGLHMPSVWYCLAFGVVTSVLGFFMFYKKQDNFILNL